MEIEQKPQSTYKLVVDADDQTVLSEYEALPKDEEGFQSEAALEQRLLDILVAQGVQHLPIHSEGELVANLRACLEELNGIAFSDSEWKQLFDGYLSNGNDGPGEKTEKFQRNHRYSLARDDGTVKNVNIVDKENVNRNKVQVINQYVPEGGTHGNRYDVTILVNGLPLVHVELKKRGGSLREAFNQIDRYGRESFWAGSALFEWVQLFVISNGTLTKYYSNTTRASHVAKMADANPATRRKATGSFKFTSYWADARNKPIHDLEDFARTFMAKRTLLAVLTRYCVLTVDGDLMVMRPYQIAATERVLNRILVSEMNPKMLGNPTAGGYVWHTTGSGKTLTSFKCAQLASQMDEVDKVLFVVDRKDLDYQTIREYDKFEKGAANGNRSTKVLTGQLDDDNCRIIVTTIQKLTTFIKKNAKHKVYDRHVVLIFDECHRSQFGDMHLAITKKFRKYHIFGFTGTPIFPENAGAGKHVELRTTAQAFGDQLHSYTIVDAIRDENVLPFRVSYVSTVKPVDDIAHEDVEGIDTEQVLLSPERISNVVAYVLSHYAQATKRSGKAYVLKYEDKGGRSASRTVQGFNSLFCCQSIQAAKLYYEEFKRQMAEPGSEKLKVGLIYSWAPNAEVDETGTIEDEDTDVTGMPQSDRDFLEAAIKDYNDMFKTKFSTEGDGFDNYYKDVSMRLKNRELDMLIVVNMFLTGFDAKPMNTLWVDKRLKMHGLIQAFSRTNRILNSVKAFGNVVCFRNLEGEVEHALGLFGDKDAGGLVLLKPYDDWMADYREAVDKLHDMLDSGEKPVGDLAENEFVKLYSTVLRIRNILLAWDEFRQDDMMTERELQDYQSVYVEIWEKRRDKSKAKKDSIIDDVEFEMELVKQVEVGIDYILALVVKYHEENCQDKEIRADIDRAIASSPTLRDKRDLIMAFIDTMSVGGDRVKEQWLRHVVKSRDEELERIIDEERLDRYETVQFVRRAWHDGYVHETGTDVMRLLPKGGGGSLFSKAKTGLTATRERVLDKLKEFYERFCDIAPEPDDVTAVEYAVVELPKD